MKRTKNSGLGLSRKGKKLITSNPRLYTISDNERQRLLSARVSNILENSFKFEDYTVHLTEEKFIFPDIPQRLQNYRELDSPLWRRASIPFQVSQEEEYERKLKDCNEKKLVDLPNYVKKEVQAEADCNTDPKDDNVESSNNSVLFESSCNTFPEDKDDVSQNQAMDSSPEETVTSQSSSATKRFFPIFGSSQRSIKKESTNPVDDSVMDFETPKTKSKSRFHLWSKKDDRKVCKSPSQDWKPPPTTKSSHKDLAQDFLALFLEKTDADVTVYGREEKPIKAHKIILRARCPKLLGDIVLENNTKAEKKREIIPLTCFSHTAVKCLMCFIYCGRLLPPGFKIESLSDKDLDEIIQLGLKYGIDLTPDPPAINGIVKAETKDSFAQTLPLDRDDKSIQTEVGEIELEEYLNDARVDERSLPYHNKTMDFNHSYGCPSPDLFEEDSFNDKVFANKLGDNSVRKRRRTRSERSLKMSDGSDSDCIIILDDEDNHDNIEKNSKSSFTSIKVSPGEPQPSFKISSSPGRNLSQTSIKITRSPGRNASPTSLGVTSSPCRSVSQNSNELYPCPQAWSKSCDDTFFANLPADEDLLNMPPTSPTGYGRASPILTTSPNLSLPSISPPAVETKIGRKPVTAKPPRKKNDEPLKKTKKSRQRTRAKVDDDYFQFDSDDDQDLLRVSSQGTSTSSKHPNSKRRTPSASQGSSRRSEQNPAHTPMLNYSLIDTPILKRELKRYGLKPLPRTKAKILLRHIYHETHKD